MCPNRLSVLLLCLFWCVFSTFGATLSDDNGHTPTRFVTTANNDEHFTTEHLLEGSGKITVPRATNFRFDEKITEASLRKNKINPIVITNINSQQNDNILAQNQHSYTLKKLTRMPKGNKLTDNYEVDENDVVTNQQKKRRRNKNKLGNRKDETDEQEEGIMEKLLPMMVAPFLISSSMVPMLMISMLVMMKKSAFMGFIGLILMIVNMFTSRRNPGGVSTHDLNIHRPENQVAMAHYGWHGDEEYGAYVNKKRR